ncbi:phosphoadenylyl-sulfate reductase [Paracidobacterium acidisoli]|uniref:Adenosine 5'-phosphosulfate reductase n=1 Tax=Paracidobacterium acidisoli TaxID=2303751 RepID=A0A372IMM3_9BACT|nr:phosphoadenylyl-sulfate reductase [Paracidobacterium acidisoli]
MSTSSIEQEVEGRAAEAQQFLREQLAEAENPCVTSSFQAEDIVVLHMVRQILPELPVLFLETGYHFPETLEYRDRMASEWGLNLINVLPELTVAEQESQFGILNQTAPDRCCALRKVGPLFGALAGYGTWITGLRRQQSKSRAELQTAEDFTLPGGQKIVKLNPLTEWTTRDVWYYAQAHEIPLLPLYDRGYTSIGCAPCTSLPSDPNDPRSGRWGGHKLECGIHIQAS